MAQFSYDARSEEGNLVSGTISAQDREEAGQKLSRQGQFVVRIRATEPDAPSGAAGAGSDNRLRVPRRKLMWVLNQLAMMVQTGVTLGSALEILSRQAKDPAMKAVLTGVSTSVHEGRPLSESMDAFPRTFPRVATSMVRASEATGTLAQVLTRIGQYMLKDQQALQRLRGALLYPAFVFLVCVSVTLFLIAVILPKFAAMYQQKGATLPAPTRVLIGLSQFVTSNGLYLSGGAVALVVGLYFWMRTPGGRAFRDRTLLALPLLGPLFDKLYQSRSFRSVGTLIDAGVPLADVLVLARDMSANHSYRELWTAVHKAVTNGEHLATPMEAFPFIPEQVREMINCGDRTGRLGQVFVALGEFIEEEYDGAMKTMCQLLEPIMIFVMGGIVGMVALALLLPLFGAASVAAR